MLYSVVIIPYRIGFNISESGPSAIFDECVTVAFFIDMCVTFNTAYVDTQSDVLIIDRALIAKRYLKRWFWIDLVSTIPFDTLFSLFTNANSSLSSIRLIRMLRLFRLFKLSRLLKMDEVLDSVGLSPSAVSLLILMLQIFFIAHLYACFWHFIAIPKTIPGEFLHNWIDFFSFTTDSNLTKYVASFYYIIVTMLTVGYGDIRPTNNIERLYGIITMLTGKLVLLFLLYKCNSLLRTKVVLCLVR